MTKMAVYQEANVILGSSLSPNNYCICKSTAIANGADVEKINTIVVNAANNRLLPVSALQPTVVTYTIRFLDWDGTVLKTEAVIAGNNPTPPANPTREGYTFNGWSPTIGTASQNQDYTATYISNSSQNQYHITFADGTRYGEGVYFYMNNGSFVPVANSSSINANDVAYVAWLGQPTMNNGQLVQSSFLIDKNESSASVKYTTDDNMYNHYSNNVYTNRIQGYGAVQQYMLNSPVVQYCSTTFNGEGQIPSTSQLHKMLDNIDDVNAALQFIGGTLLKTNTDIGSNSDDWYYRMQNKYWSNEAEFESEDSVYIYGMQWIGGYSQYTSREVTDPQTNITTTEWYSVPVSYQELATSYSITAFVRAIKPISEIAPLVPTGTIYYQYDVAANVTPECPEQYRPQDTAISTFSGWQPSLYPANKDQIYTAKWTSASLDPIDPGVETVSGVSVEWREKANYTTYDTQEWLLGGTVPINVSCQICFFKNGSEMSDNDVIARYNGSDITAGSLSWDTYQSTSSSNNLSASMSGKRFQAVATGNCIWNSSDSFTCTGKYGNVVVCSIPITVLCYKSSISSGKQDGDVVPASEWN